jgi:5-formyltetrahydrofolate cyclo-ligase
MRQRRRALSPRERRRAGQALARVLGRSPLFQRAQRLALFFAADGEIDTAPLIQLAWQRRKQVYLPVLQPFGPNRLWFRRYQPQSALNPNRFGIPEPRRRRGADLAPRNLDLVLAPLVAFDRQGHRLGMGGGYYDRTFSFLHQRRQWQHPRLVGLAYTFQQVDALPAEPWDVPLWGVATETDLHRFHNT